MKKSSYVLTFLFLCLCYLIIVGTALFAQTNCVVKTANFNGIKANGLKKIVLVQNDSTKIEFVSNDCNLNYSIKDGILFLQSSIPNLKGTIKLFAPTFTSIELNGGAELSNENTLILDKFSIESNGASEISLDVDAQDVSLKIAGASDVKLSGKANKLNIISDGASDVDAYQLKGLIAMVEANGASDIKVNPDSLLVADISGASSIKYLNEPKVKEININGFTRTMQKNINDTLISESGSNGFGEDFFDFDKSSKPKFVGNWSGVELGINGYITPDFSIDMPSAYKFLELNYAKSMNFNLNFFQQSVNLIGNKFGFVTGLGLQWNNYRFDNNMILRNDSTVIAGSYDNSKAYYKSKLLATYLVLPLLLEFQTNNEHDINSFHLAVGVIGALRIGSHSKQVFSSSNGKSKPKVYDDFYLNPYKLDATVRIGWGVLNLYANYSLTEMFRNNRGPVLNPFSIGLCLPLS